MTRSLQLVCQYMENISRQPPDEYQTIIRRYVRHCQDVCSLYCLARGQCTMLSLVALTIAAVFCLPALTVSAATYHVWTNSPANGPGTAWSNAFHDIQSAVDVSISNDVVLVTNGCYSAGGRAVYGAMTNRLVIDRPIAVKSVNGPTETVISGARDPITTNGDAAIRCAFVGPGATLIGFTLTDGHTRRSGDGLREQCGGGVWSAQGTVSNCVVTSCTAASSGGGIYFHDMGQVQHAIIAGNKAGDSGGGVVGGVLVDDCTVISNTAQYSGGGLFCYSYSVVRHCVIAANTAKEEGGGLCGLGQLESSAVLSNAANRGGGVFCSAGALGTGASVSSSILVGNVAATEGGGVYCCDGGRILESTICGNVVSNSWSRGAGVWCGTGVFGFTGTVTRCTIESNRTTGANSDGGGAYCSFGILDSCIIRENRTLGASSRGAGVCLVRGSVLNCIVTENTAEQSRAGGIYCYLQGTVANCTIVGNNAASSPGGVYCDGGGDIRNSIIYSNSAPSSANWRNDGSGMTYVSCCSWPTPPVGDGNIEEDPQLIPVSLRLRNTSPCIDAGASSNTPPCDRDGETRWDHPGHNNGPSIWDIGADEFVDEDTDGMADSWERENFGSTTNRDGAGDWDVDGLADQSEYDAGTNPRDEDSDADQIPDGWECRYSLNPLVYDADSDPDQDRFSNLAEYVAATDPTNATSFLRITGLVLLHEGTTQVVSWESNTGRYYSLYLASNLTHGAWDSVADAHSIKGSGAALEITNCASASPRFYRIEVHIGQQP